MKAENDNSVLRGEMRYCGRQLCRTAEYGCELDALAEFGARVNHKNVLTNKLHGGHAISNRAARALVTQAALRSSPTLRISEWSAL